jgi:hypothetical protein
MEIFASAGGAVTTEANDSASRRKIIRGPLVLDFNIYPGRICVS